MTKARWLVLGALLVLAVGVAWSARPVAFTAADRVDRIAAELRCPVCQGLSVQDSPSETARAMKELVATRVAQGRTDDQIKDEFQRSYGEWILLSPPLLSPSGLVWLAPLAAVVLGAMIAWRRTQAPAPALTGPTDAQVRGLRDLVARDTASDETAGEGWR